jgi:hypothetical protein
MTTTFKAASRGQPCPVCGGQTSGCKRGGDGLLLCRCSSGDVAGFVRLSQSDKDPQWTAYRPDGDPRLRERSHEGNGRAEKPSGCAADWQARAAELCWALTPALRDEVAGELGLPPATLADLAVGWCAAGPHRDPETGKPLGGCWTFPEVNATGKVVGLTCRYRDGTKKAWPGGARGLFCPDGWREQPGPLLLPEGPTDVAALTAMGLPAVGRPSNRAGVDHLVELLRDFQPGRQIVVLGEWDPKDTGQWPGVEGARVTAAALTGKLGRAVTWALPPGGAKDVRAWLQQQGPDLADAEALAVLGRKLADGLKTNVEKAAEGDAPSFPPILLASQLTTADPARAWLWKTAVARQCITLLSALWKAGKTTVLAHLLRALGSGEDFFGLEVARSRALVVTEENESLWAQRRDALGLGDHLRFFVRPFVGKPSWEAWRAFLGHLSAVLESDPVDLIVFDPLTNLWPVRDENDAAQVIEALMPLRGLTGDAGLLLCHHFRKSDGQEGTGSRGSGALTGFVDGIVELRRYAPGDKDDRRRVLTGYGRWPDTLKEIVARLSDDGRTYTAEGDKTDVRRRELREVLREVLPAEPPGKSYQEIVSDWPADVKPRRQSLLAALKEGAEGTSDVPPWWGSTGGGKKGDPHRYYRLRD